ncbi:hypothetical protein [Halocatena marina]|uniref:Uncharacterized protein n=1 Tax=Halocatena marina TaxID=2934937 RepID=A0ABD5YMY1_9EURY|nr:hypothetical protein [Halocatena marina]
MTQTIQNSGAVQSLLVRYRLAIYILGLFAISAPIVLDRFGISVSSEIRTVIVLASLFVMVLTYVAERQSFERADEEPTRKQNYSRQARTAIAFALIGVAIGGYVWFTIDPVTGLLFVLGALLFVRIAYAGSIR